MKIIRMYMTSLYLESSALTSRFFPPRIDPNMTRSSSCLLMKHYFFYTLSIYRYHSIQFDSYMHSIYNICIHYVYLQPPDGTNKCSFQRFLPSKRFFWNFAFLGPPEHFFIWAHVKPFWLHFADHWSCLQMEVLGTLPPLALHCFFKRFVICQFLSIFRSCLQHFAATFSSNRRHQLQSHE